MRFAPRAVPCISLLLLGIALLCPGASPAAEPLPAERLLGRVEGPLLRAALERRWGGAGLLTSAPGDWREEALVREVYVKRGFSPVFLGDARSFDAVSRLPEELASCARHGLSPDHFAPEALGDAVQAVPVNAHGIVAKLTRPVDEDKLAEALARLDALLVDRYLAYGRELTGAGIPGDGEPALQDSVTAALVAGTPPDAESFAPDHPQYAALEAALAVYRRVAEQGGWPEIRDGGTLRAGDRDARVRQVRARLDAEERLLTGSAPPVPADTTLFDDALAERVQEFQSRHALDQDGAVGKMTLAALNATAEERVRQIEITMARWRRGPRDNPDYRVEANIPGMQVFLYRGGKPVLALKAVVGSGRKTAMWKGKQSKAETPELEDEIETIVVNPRWYVPESIVRTELKQSEVKKPGFLDKGGYEWYDPKAGTHGPASELPDSVWTSAASDLRIRQKPGAGNALGKLKFLFHNRYAVYMHDTPEKRLFARGRRNYSHGCVRVENPVQLADSLLAHSRVRPKAPLARLLADTARVTIDVIPHVPIHLVYRTVWVQTDGRIDFLPDIYGKDEEVARGLPLSAELTAVRREAPRAEEDGEEAADPISP